MRRNRRVKILATLGPASSDPEQIEKLFLAGVDVFRINMSHAAYDLVQRYIDIIRAIETKHNRPIGILVDLQGPKLRVGMFAAERAFLKDGATFRFDTLNEPGTAERVSLPHPVIFESVQPGHKLLLDDGKLQLRVLSKTATEIVTEVVVGGPLASRKGVSLPDSVLTSGALTDKDRADLAYAAPLGVDWIALSFVQRASDVLEAKRLVAGRAAIMSKIEKPAALNELDAILAASDGLMIARGDLGVELPVQQVPGIQKRITRMARRVGKPVVVATQMLESMISSPVPTRAEVSDVATAVFEGADAIMLSAESAAGEFGYEAVTMMDKVAREVEQDAFYQGIIHAQRTEPEATSPDVIAAAARSVGETLNVAAIICFTGSGSSGLRASRERPRQPVIALSPNAATGRKLAIAWGLHCVLTKDATSYDDMVDRSCQIAKEEGFAKPGDKVIITAGIPLGTPGATNMLRIAEIK